MKPLSVYKSENTQTLTETHMMIGVGKNDNPDRNKDADDAQYLIYVLLGVDCLLLSVIINFLWKKRYVVVTGNWGEILDV